MYIYKTYLYIIANVVNSHVFASISLFPCTSNLIKMLAELGRLCGHESRSGSIHDVR